jgi:hypothetical protein
MTEDRHRAVHRIAHWFAIPATVRFLSAEPIVE